MVLSECHFATALNGESTGAERGNGASNHHYDGDRLVAEEDMTGTVREYLYAGGEAPTAMRSRNSDGSYSNYFFVTNTHGDVVALTDRDGNIVNRYAYGPWGEATRVSEQVHQPFRYAGYRYEDGFDLYYLRARWMDPNTGRFLSRDPELPNPMKLCSLNRYTYTHDNPSSSTDPSGRYPCKQGIYRLVAGVDALERQYVGSRPNNLANVGAFVHALWAIYGGFGTAIDEVSSEGWRREFVDEANPANHLISFVVLGYSGMSGPGWAWGHEAWPAVARGVTPWRFTGDTQEDYRLSRAAQSIGENLYAGVDEVRDHRVATGRQRLGEGLPAWALGSEIIRRFGHVTGNCTPGWAGPGTPFRS